MSSYNSNNRISFASIKNQLQYPDFLEVQLKSFRTFFNWVRRLRNRKNEGLYTVFKENFPITDTRNNFVLEFLDYFIDPPRYTIEECLGQGLTYGAPLKAKQKLYCTDPEHEDFDTVIEDVYLGNVPYMTPKGTFRDQWSRAWSFLSCTGLRCFFRAEYSCEWYRFIPPELFRSRFLDRVCYGHQQRDVCVYRPEEKIAGNHFVTSYRF